jgi:uncharacterized protein YfaS (alpha-2-macroglobulin family)
MRRLIPLGLLCLAGAAACTPPSVPPAEAPLATVSPLPKPLLPAWILSVSPTGVADENAQIRVRFRDDVIPVESLESPDRTAALSRFSLEPAIPGRFVFYTPRLVGFEADAAPPLATRFRVTLHAGLADLRGDTLGADLAWTFSTTHVALQNLPAQEKDAEPPVVDLRPEIHVGSNVALDPASLEERAVLIPADVPSAAPVPMTLVSPTPAPSATATLQSDASGERAPEYAAYTLVPRTELTKATAYRLVVREGLAPARGNLPSDKSFIGRIRTYGPLTLRGVEPYDRPLDNNGSGRFVSGAPQLNFSNPLADGATKAVSVSPAPSPLPVYAPSGGTTVQIGAGALSPNARYAIRVAADLKDRFGQTLGADANAEFSTSDFAADLWAPSGTTVFPADQNLQINIVTTNLPEARVRAAYRVVQPTALVYADSVDANASDANGGPQLLPPFDSWPASPIVQRKNVATTTTVPLRAKLGGPTGMLAYGVSARTNQYKDSSGSLVWAEPRYAGLVQLTNVGVFAQWFPHRGIVRTNRLSDGSPIAGAKIAIYESRVGAKDRPQPEPCAAGVTNANGALDLDGAAFSRCAATSTSATDAPNLFVVARDGKDWASVRTLSWSGGYDDGLNGGWSAGQPDSRGALVSDRSLYQPGETAYFSGIAYFVTDGVLGRGKAASYGLTLESPSGKKRDLGSRAPDPFGAFSLELPFARDQELGYYTLHARASNGEELYGNFRVAEFKPPNFKVTLTLARQFAPKGSSVHASAQSDYLFGAPVAGGRARIDVTRQRTYFSPKGWDGWDYARSWFYPEQEPSVSSDVLQKDATVGTGGSSAFDVPVGTDLPYPMAYQVDVQTTDVANVAVSDSKSFTALPSDTLILLSAPFVGNAGSALAIKATATNPSGAPVEGRSLHVVLQHRKFAQATQLVEGGETPRESVSYETVAEADVTSGKEPQTVSLTPTVPGSYRVRANFAGATDDTTATDHDLWVTGPGEADWGAPPANHLTIKLDKAKYRPGEIATVLIASPYPEAELDFSVIRAGVLYQSRAIVKGAAPQVRFTVTQAMLPNASVEGVLIRRGAPLSKGVPQGLDQLARIGFAAFSTSLDDKYVKVNIAPAHASPAPGATQSVRVHLADSAGKPVAGEVVLMVVNEAVLQLTGYRPPDLVQTVYAEQSISTRWADSRVDVSLTSPERPVEKGFGFGGGFLAGAGDTRVRTKFKPIAYYNGALRTNAAGDANVTFTLPDDLTTWRVMALALTRDARFGNGDSTFLTTKPLIANPVLPQFARPGDAMNAGVSVTNTAKGTGTLSISGVLGGGLAFAEAGKTAQTTSLEEPVATLTKAYRFPMIVTSAHDGRMRFGVKLGAAADAFEVPLPVRTTDVLESVVQTGATADAATIPLVVDPATPTDAGGLDLGLSSTLIADVVEPVRAALADDSAYGESVASRIGVAADAILLARRYQQTPPASLATSIGKDVAALRALRAADGGIAEWPGSSSSDPFATAFAAAALAHAREAGSADAATELSRLVPVLKKILANPGVYSWCKSEPCRSQVRLAALTALAESGERRSDFIGAIFAQRDRLDMTERIVLARQLARLPAWAAQAKALREKLQENVYETGRSASVNAFDSGVAAQAQLVRLLVETREPVDRVDNAFRSLLGLRRNGLWGCGCANAQALDAVVAYASLDKTPPNFTLSAQVGSAAPRQFAFNGYKVTSADVAIPARDLPRGRSAVALRKSGNGTLHYVVAYRYRVASDTPGKYQGLRIDRIVRPANSNAVLATFGLAKASPLTVTSAQVFEIEDRIVSDHPADRVAIVDPLPAGLEAVDSTFQTSSQAHQARTDNWQIDYQTIYHDRVEAFARHLDAGVYAMHYIVRSVTPGTYAWPAADAHLQFAPEEFGRTAFGTLTVR